MIDSYRFLSGSLDSLVKTLVDFNHKTFKSLKKEIVDSTSEFLKKKDYPNEIERLEKILYNDIRENDPKLLKIEFPDRWKYLTKKLAYPFEYFNSIDDYQNPVDKLKKEDFFSNLKYD